MSEAQPISESVPQPQQVEKPLAPGRPFFRVITSLVMPGGWHKPEKDRLGRDLPEPIRASTYEALVSAVTKFRTDNVIPLGAVRREINEYICTSFPHMCHSVKDAHVEIRVNQKPRTVSGLTDSVLQWLDAATTNHSDECLVLPEIAKKRAEICAQCKFNVRWNDRCPACTEVVGRMSAILRMGRDVPQSHRLKACQILRHENRAAVWLRGDRLGTSLDLPQKCWRRNAEDSLK